MATLIRIQIDELKEMKGRMSKSKALIMQETMREMSDYGRTLRDKMKEEAPVKDGVLRNSIRYQVRQQGTRGAELVVTAGNKKRPPVVVKTILFGSKRHVILPRRRQFLKFVNRNGKTVFARRVKHPGTNPNNFMERAWEKTKRDRAEMTKNIGRISVSKILTGRG